MIIDRQEQPRHLAFMRRGENHWKSMESHSFAYYGVREALEGIFLFKYFIDGVNKNHTANNKSINHNDVLGMGTFLKFLNWLSARIE